MSKRWQRSSQFLGNVQPVWACSPTGKKCLCHEAESSGKLTLFTEKSWEKFETCSLRRLLTIMNHWKEGPKGGYHRQCYQSYANVGNISRTKGTADKATLASANHEIAADKLSKEPPAKRYHRSHVQRFDIDKCIACQVEKCKRGKGGRSREALTENIS